MVLKFTIKGGLHAIHVFDAHRDDAERRAGPLMRMPDYQFDDFVYLGGRTLLQPINPRLLLDHFMSNHGRPTRAWEGDKAVLVDVVVREIDECLVTAAVVPVEI